MIKKIVSHIKILSLLDLLIMILANPIFVLFYVSIISGPHHEYQSKRKWSIWKRNQIVKKNEETASKYSSKKYPIGKKLVLTSLIGKVELGKEPKKNFSVLEFLLSIPFLLWANCGHNYLLINIPMSENPVSILHWGFTVKLLKEENKSNTPPFTF